MNDVAIIVPALDEAATIAEITARAKALGVFVLVVDDAGGDRTAEEAASAGAEVLSLAERRGNLGAIQAGLELALARGYQWLVTLDADGQHAPEDVPALLAEARRSGEVVIGSCPERSSWRRRMVWGFFRKISGLDITDMTSGFKVYPRPAAELLRSRRTSRLVFQDLPCLLLLAREGFRLREVRVEMAPRRVGASKVFPSWGRVAVYLLRVTAECLRHRARAVWRRFRPAPEGEAKTAAASFEEKAPAMEETS